MPIRVPKMVKSFFRKMSRNHPKYSSAYADQNDALVIYAPIKEWEESYDVKVWVVDTYRHKNTGERKLYPAKYSTRVETIFDKSIIKQKEDIKFDYHPRKNVSATSAEKIKRESLPQEILQHID